MYTQSVFSVAYQMPDHNDHKISPDDSLTFVVLSKKSFLRNEWTDAQAAIKKFVIQHNNPAVVIAEVSILNAGRLFWLFYSKLLFSIFTVINVRDANDVKSTLESSNFIFEYLSVGLFFIRFFAAMVDILRNVHDKEKFLEALSVRGIFMLRDLIRTTINLFSNFGKYFGVDLKDMFIDLFDSSIRVTGVLNVAALLFDMATTLIQWLCIDRLKYKRQCIELAHDAEALAIIEKNWQQKTIRNIFILTLLGVTVIGVSASLILTGGLAAPICNAVIFLAVSFSRTSESFVKLMQAKNNIAVNNNDENKKTYQDARNTLVVNIAKNVLLPVLVMGVCIAAWEAALVCLGVLLLLNVGKKMAHHFFKPPPDKEKKSLSTQSPDFNVIDVLPEMVAVEASAGM